MNIKKTIVAVASVASLFAFANDITGPRYTVEGGIAGTIQIEGYKKDKSKKIKGWARSTDINLSFAPSWNYQVDEKFGVSFGPTAEIGLLTSLVNVDYKTTVEEKANAAQNVDDNLMAFEGGLGGALDLNFTLPQGEVIFLGFDTSVKGVGIIKKDEDFGGQTQERGISYELGMTVGGKVSDKIKLGVRGAYQYQGLWKVRDGATAATGFTNVNSFIAGVKFGYTIGD